MHRAIRGSVLPFTQLLLATRVNDSGYVTLACEAALPYVASQNEQAAPGV